MKKAEDIDRAERERKSRDLWKVYNPTNQDFVVRLNVKVSPELWTIHAKKQEIVPEYVAIKYCEEMSTKIIYDKSDKAVIEENEKRMAKGFDKMDLHTEQQRFESRNLKRMGTKKGQLRDILVIGLHREYGRGEIEDYQKNLDRRSFATDDSVSEALGVASEPKAPKKPVEPIVEPPTPGTTKAPPEVVEEIEEELGTVEKPVSVPKVPKKDTGVAQQAGPAQKTKKAKKEKK
ncbi:hypothetical protein LCGC14_0995860 [marine sediment metagenome]|uniref:Uncharacterized protein n=1 Tax=marine sediment metagenome TaxID=412755 RepID=A0A0F9N925_9ZZZZ